MLLPTIARRGNPLTEAEIRAALDEALARLLPGCRRVLLLPPDLTRLHSGAGPITEYVYHQCAARGIDCDVLPALGTHVPMTRAECAGMFGSIPYERFLTHDWRGGVTEIGTVPAAVLSELSDGLLQEALPVRLDQALLDPSYDLLLSIGQVVPHEVVGMANYTKNIVVGCGGSEFINASHILGAVYGLERMMGRDHSPVRQLFDYVQTQLLHRLPLCYVLTVCEGAPCGLFIGTERDAFEQAVALSQARNITLLDEPLPRAVVWLDPGEYRSTWLGNKAVYRTRMAIADGGELVILAPGVERFGEDPAIDALIRRYGYTGRDRILALRARHADLRANDSAAAHLIHGSPDGRFTITYCTEKLPEAAVRGVGYGWRSAAEAIAHYRPETLQPGWNCVDGESFYFIPNPAVGLWASRARFEEV